MSLGMGTQSTVSPDLSGADFILRNIDDAVIVTDTQAVVTYWNEGATRLFGWTSQEMIGRPYPDRFPPAVRIEIQQAIGQRLQGNEWDGEFEDYRKDGSRVWISARVRKVTNHEGCTIGILGISKDISAAKRSEAELRQREAFVHGILDSMDAHISVLDRDGVIIAVNRSWQQFAVDNAPIPGTEPEHVSVGTNYLEICRQATNGCRQEALQVANGISAVLSGTLPKYKQEYRCDSPTMARWFSLTVTPLARKEGGVVVTHVDITERRRIEAEIREHRDRLQMAMATSRMGVWVQNLSTQKVSLSPEVYSLFGLRHFDGTLTSIAAALHPADLESAQASYRETVENGTPLALDIRAYRPDGRLRSISALGMLHRDDAGQPVSVIGTVRDVTNKRREAALIKGQSDILSRIVRGEPLSEILHHLVGLVETLVDGGLCSIFIKDPTESVLCLAAGPSLPLEYNRAVQTVPIGPANGSCGTCAYLAQPVLTTDIATDPLWENYRSAALPHGLRACLSVPILSENTSSTATTANVLGTFAIYRTDATAFDEHVTNAMATATHLAGVAMEKEVARRRLGESEQRYRQLLDLVPVGILMHSRGVVRFANPRFLRLAGYPEEANLEGRPVEDFVPPEEREPLRRRIEDLLDQKIRLGASDGRLLRPNGESIPVSVVTTKVRIDGTDSVLVAMLDRSEEQRASHLLHAILSSVTDAIVCTDIDGRIVMANAATERLFGYTVTELLGQNITRLIPEAYQANRRTETPGSLPGTPREVNPRRKDGTVFPADISIASFEINGKPHYTGVVRDISVRRKLEDQLRQAQKMDAIGQLAGGIAHDFNNLLTVINGQSSRILSRLPDGDSLQEPLADILAAGERAATLTAQLLTFSRRAIIEPKILDLNQVVTGTTRMLRRLIGEDITLLTQLRASSATVKMDLGQLEQVLINLALNARDAMPQGGKLTIGTSSFETSVPSSDPDREPPPGTYVQLWVEDTGNGISDEVRQRIFEPFFTTKGVGKGSGLGLATVYGIIRQAGGYVSFDSEPGKGTTFRVLLPPQKKRASTVKPPGSPESPTGTETILLSEDEDVVRKLVRQVLELHGYTVIDASGGTHAIERCATYARDIHLLLTDVVMPDLGGRALADEIRKHRPNIRVLYMSGYTDDAITRHGVETAVDSFIQKPFSPPTLMRKIREVLDRKT